MAEKPELKIEIDDKTSRGTYTNFALISHSETEFLLDFSLLQPQTPTAKVVSRIITSPNHIKRLVTAIQDNIQKYEARFGTIRVEDKPVEPGPKGIYH